MRAALLRLGLVFLFAVLLLGGMYMVVRNRGGGGEVILYDQYDHEFAWGPLGTSGAAGQLADDFVVPVGQTWVVDQVEVAGVGFPTTKNSTYAAQSINVLFYDDVNSHPGAQIAAQNDISYTLPAPDSADVQAIPTAVTPVPGFDPKHGSYLIKINPVTLSPGTCWLSVQANTSEQWFWVERLKVSNHPAADHNQYLSPCAAWGHLADCWQPGGSTQGQHDQVDLVFRLRGTILSEASSPTVTPTNASPSATPNYVATQTAAVQATRTAAAQATMTEVAVWTQTAVVRATQTAALFTAAPVPPSATGTSTGLPTFTPQVSSTSTPTVSATAVPVLLPTKTATSTPSTKPSVTQPTTPSATPNTTSTSTSIASSTSTATSTATRTASPPTKSIPMSTPTIAAVASPTVHSKGSPIPPLPMDTEVTATATATATVTSTPTVPRKGPPGKP